MHYMYSARITQILSEPNRSGWPEQRAVCRYLQTHIVRALRTVQPALKQEVFDKGYASGRGAPSLSWLVQPWQSSMEHVHLYDDRGNHPPGRRRWVGAKAHILPVWVPAVLNLPCRFNLNLRVKYAIFLWASRWQIELSQTWSLKLEAPPDSESDTQNYSHFSLERQHSLCAYL